MRSIVLPLGLSVLCLRSIFRSGYLLQVDIVFGPRAGPVAHDVSAPASALQWAAVHVVGGGLAGKLYAVGTLFLAGFGPMVLFRRAPWYAQSAAGFLGALNPFVYDRFVEGQWYVVIAVAGLFLWLAAWEGLQARPDLTRAVLLALCGAAIVSFDPHMAGPLTVLVVVGTCWSRGWRDRNRFRYLLLSVGLLALLLLPGIIAFFAGSSAGDYSTVRRFTRADFEFFRSSSSPDYGLFVNLAGLYGYWAERIGRFAIATGGHAWWPLTTLPLILTAVAGARLRRDRAWLLVCGIAGLLLSASTALPWGVSAASWLASRVPLVGAYREPEKWSALWLLALVVLAAGAIEAIARPTRGRRAAPVTATVLAYFLVLAALIPAGVSQIRTVPSIVSPAVYPHDWYVTAAALERVSRPGDAIAILPWHLYQPLRASEGRLVADPAPVFFPGRLVMSRSPDIPGRATLVLSPSDRIGAVRDGTGTCALAETIRGLGIRWALVLDAAEGAQTVGVLRRCGYSLVVGRLGFTALLRVGPGRKER